MQIISSDYANMDKIKRDFFLFASLRKTKVFRAGKGLENRLDRDIQKKGQRLKADLAVTRGYVMGSIYHGPIHWEEVYQYVDFYKEKEPAKKD